MKKIFMVTFFILIYFFISCSKTDKSIVIEASSELTPIATYVGKEIFYKIKIISKKNIDYKFSDISFDSESDKSRILKTDTKIKNKGSYKEAEIIYTLAFYDIGGFVISPFKINYVYNGANEILYGEEAKVIIKPFSDGEKLPPLKEILKIKMPFYVWIVLVIILIILALLIFFYLKRKNKTNNNTTENIFTPEDKEALDLLKNIDITKYSYEESYAEYYFLITEIFKRYLSKRYLLGIVEMTTSDFERIIKHHIVAKKTQILNFFKYADTIKFSKEKSNYEAMKKDFDFCVAYIESYKAREKESEINIEVNTEINSADKKA